jgi:hypothetical protein
VISARPNFQIHGIQIATWYWPGGTTTVFCPQLRPSGCPSTSARGLTHEPSEGCFVMTVKGGVGGTVTTAR